MKGDKVSVIVTDGAQSWTEEVVARAPGGRVIAEATKDSGATVVIEYGKRLDERSRLEVPAARVVAVRSEPRHR